MMVLTGKIFYAKNMLYLNRVRCAMLYADRLVSPVWSFMTYRYSRKDWIAIINTYCLVSARDWIRCFRLSI